MAEQTDVGLIGLAVMGSNLALNIAEKGYRIAVYDREVEVTDAFVANSGTLSSQIFSASDLKSLVAMIKRPRSIILLIKAGSPVDQVIETLAPLLEEGDTIVDGGNTEFNDTVRRSNKLKEKGISTSPKNCTIRVKNEFDSEPRNTRRNNKDMYVSRKK